EGANLAESLTKSADGSLRTEATTLLARGWTNLGGMAAARGCRDEGSELVKRGLRLANRAPGKPGRDRIVANAFSALGLIAAESGREEEAATYFGRAVAMYEESGDMLGRIRELGNLAIAYGIQGDMQRSGEMMERCLALEREIDFRQSMPYTLSNLGVHHFRMGDLSRAEACNREALAPAEETGQRQIHVGILVNLVSVYAGNGDVPSAFDAATNALTRAVAIGLDPLTLQALTAFAEAEAAGGHTAEAARLLRVVLANPNTRSYTLGVADALWRELEFESDGCAPVDVAFDATTPLTDVVAEALGRAGLRVA